MAAPFFSVLITTYNRAEHSVRCVNSCRKQTLQDFEIVVVDDASNDGTEAVLAALHEPRLRIVRHERNRGISPARASAVCHARGEWFVMMDSDWELMPDALARLRILIAGLPQGVRIIRSRLRWDDGRVSPTIMPTGVTNYRDRLRWNEALAVTGGGSSDAGHCMHRSVFDTTTYMTDRRGAMEALWEQDLARREPSLWVTDILGVEHSDAPNSHSRDTSAGLVQRLLIEAPDSLWMTETMLVEHAEGLARDAPRYRLSLMQLAARDAFLAGRRLTGIRHSWDAVRNGGASLKMLAIVALGMLGPRALAHGTIRRRKSRLRDAHPGVRGTPVDPNCEA
jgi:glycosyl transferase family 2